MSRVITGVLICSSLQRQILLCVGERWGEGTGLERGERERGRESLHDFGLKLKKVLLSE